MNQQTGIKKERSLQSKAVAITGASSGVGIAGAIEIESRPAAAVLAARREDALKKVAAECKTYGLKTLVVVTNVKDSIAVNILAVKAKEWSGKIGARINNAGVLTGGFEETPLCCLLKKQYCDASLFIGFPISKHSKENFYIKLH